MFKRRKIMDKLVEQINQLCNTFFQQELGNRLSQFAWVSFKETLINMVKNYKPEINKLEKD